MVIVLASAFARTQKFSPSPKEIGRSDVSERECKSIEVAMEVFFFFVLHHVHDHPGPTAPIHQTPTIPTPHPLNPKPTATGSQWEQDVQVQNEIRQLKLTGELGGDAPFSGC